MPIKATEGDLRIDMKEIASESPPVWLSSSGRMLRRKGHVCNIKKVYRIYREEGLMVKGRKRALGTRQSRCRVPTGSIRCGHWTL